MSPLFEPTASSILGADHNRRHAIKDVLAELLDEQTITRSSARRHHGWKLEKLLLAKGYLIVSAAALTPPAAVPATPAAAAGEAPVTLRYQVQVRKHGTAAWVDCVGAHDEDEAEGLDLLARVAKSWKGHAARLVSLVLHCEVRALSPLPAPAPPPVPLGFRDWFHVLRLTEQAGQPGVAVGINGHRQYYTLAQLTAYAAADLFTR